MSTRTYLASAQQLRRRMSLFILFFSFSSGISCAISGYTASDSNFWGLDLTMHHTIEERQIFPILAKRMPSFAEDEAHIKSHHGIHEGPYAEWTANPTVDPSQVQSWHIVIWPTVGLDKLGVLLSKYSADQTTYNPTEMRECLDSWREVLFRHLDEEVWGAGWSSRS